MMKYEERPGIAERVVAARKRRGLRQRDAAAEIGICVKYLARVEEGWVPHEGIWEKVREWVEAEEEKAAVEEEKAAVEEAAASEEERPAERPREPDLPPRVPPQVRLAIRRLVGRA